MGFLLCSLYALLRSWNARGVFIAMCGLGLPFSAALAQSSGDSDEAKSDEPLTIIISASRFAETVDETLSPVTVITRADIEEQQATTVEEVLRAVPGITLANSGGAGKLTSLFLRGTESNHVLVLIDGVKIGNATFGSTPFQHLPLDQIEKIEVVRGPRSSLYGSEAIGGVIQIFTRRGGGATRPAFSVSAGSHNARRFNAGVSGGDDAGWYNLSLSAYETDGFNACRGSANPFAGCFVAENALERDRDGHENTALSARGGVAVADFLDIEGNFLNSASATEYDGAYGNQSETVNRTASVKATFRVSANWQSSLLLGQHRDESETLLDCDAQANPASFEPCSTNNPITGNPERVAGVLKRDSFNTKREQLSLTNDFRASQNNRILWGIDYHNDQVSAATAYAVDERDNVGVFVAWRSAVGDDDFEVSLRADDNQQFGDKSTGGIGWGRALGDGFRITASYGTAHAAPTFNDLYYPNSGNPDLAPESSTSFDFGLTYDGDGGGWSFNYYRTKIDDLIVLNPQFSPVNTSRAEISGLELSANIEAGAWKLNANLALQNPKNASGGADDGNLLARRAQRVMHLDAARPFGRHSVGFAWRSQSATFDNPANTRRIDAFTVLDARGEYRLARHWALGVKINNLFDRKYESIAYYPQDRRNYLATLRYLP